MDDLIEFRHEMTYGLMKDSAVTLVDRARDKANGKCVKHGSDVITIGTEIVNDITARGILYQQATLMAGYLNHQDASIL